MNVEVVPGKAEICEVVCGGVAIIPVVVVHGAMVK